MRERKCMKPSLKTFIFIPVLLCLIYSPAIFAENTASPPVLPSSLIWHGNREYRFTFSYPHDWKIKIQHTDSSELSAYFYPTEWGNDKTPFETPISIYCWKNPSKLGSKQDDTPIGVVRLADHTMASVYQDDTEGYGSISYVTTSSDRVCSISSTKDENGKIDYSFINTFHWQSP